MNIIFNKCIFSYLCIFYNLTKFLYEFQVFLLIFPLPIFLSKYPSIFFYIFDISVKFKYRYIRNYQYFVPWLYVSSSKLRSELLKETHDAK